MKPGKARSSVTLVAVGAVIMLAPLWMALAMAGILIGLAVMGACGAWRKLSGRPGPLVLLGVPVSRVPVPPPGHPDREIALSEDEMAVFEGIEAGLTAPGDAGLGILGSDEKGGAQ